MKTCSRARESVAEADAGKNPPPSHDGGYGCNHRVRSVLVALALALLFMLAYAPAWPGSFVWDDDSNLLENPHVRGPGGSAAIWFTTESLEYYPVFFSSLRLQWHFLGEQPSGYLLVNLALHLLNTMLLWRLLRGLGFRGAGVSALLFALHPVAVHSVCWISQHKTVLSTFFYLLSGLFFIRYLAYAMRRASSTLPVGAELAQPEADPGRATSFAFRASEVKSSTPTGVAVYSETARTAMLNLHSPAVYYVLSFVFFLAGLLTKPTLVFLPVFYFALAMVYTLLPAPAQRELRPPGEPLPLSIRALAAGRHLLRLAPWFIAAAAIGLLRIYWQPPPELDDATTRVGEGWVRAAVAGCSIGYSAWKILLPVDLMMIYPRWAISAWPPWFLLPMVLLIGVLLLLWNKRRIMPGLWLGCLFSVLAMLPVSGLFDNTYFAFAQVANHWMYPALPGLIPIVVGGLWRLGDAFPKAGILFTRFIPALLAAALALLTASEARRFHKDETYYTRGIRENPDNVIAHHNLANLRLERGDHDAALRHYLEAVRIHPNFWQARIGAGKILSDRGNLKEAFDQISAAYTVFPENPEALFRLGVLYGQAGMHEEARYHLQASLVLNPHDPVAWNNLGVSLHQMGEHENALIAFEQALLLDPDYEAARRNAERSRARSEEPESD